MNRLDITELLTPTAKASILAMVFLLGWILGVLIIGNKCETKQYFTIFSDTYVCHVVAK